MSAIIDALKKVGTRKMAAGNEQNIQIPKERSAETSPKTIVFVAVLILGIAITMVIFYGLNTNIKLITRNSRLAEDRVRNLERSSEYLNENLRASNTLLKDLIAGVASLEKRAASNDDGAKILLSGIEGINTAVKNLQNEYSSVSAQLAELKKNVDMLAAKNVETE